MVNTFGNIYRYVPFIVIVYLIASKSKHVSKIGAVCFSRTFVFRHIVQ